MLKRISTEAILWTILRAPRPRVLDSTLTHSQSVIVRAAEAAPVHGSGSGDCGNSTITHPTPPYSKPHTSSHQLNHALLSPLAPCSQRTAPCPNGSDDSVSLCTHGLHICPCLAARHQPTASPFWWQCSSLFFHPTVVSFHVVNNETVNGVATLPRQVKTVAFQTSA